MQLRDNKKVSKVQIFSKFSLIFILLIENTLSAVNINDYEEYYKADFLQLSQEWTFVKSSDPTLDNLIKDQTLNPDLIYDSSQYSMSGSNLVLKTELDTGTNKFKGILMHTRNGFYFKYGIVEIKFSIDSSIQDTADPTVIQIGLVGMHFKSQKEVWPTNGEFQIFETMLDDIGGNQKARKYKTRLSSGTKVSNDICQISLCQQVIEQSLYKNSIETTYRLVWDQNQIEWLAQKPNEAFQSIKVITNSANSIIPNYPQYLVINVAVDKDATIAANPNYQRQVTINSIRVLKKIQT